MVTNDMTILKLKHRVLYEVAKSAWNGTLDADRDQIPYKIIPGPQATYRCCIYKEREIIRQRVRLSEGKCPSDRNSNSVVQVINSACEECPIASYVVTDNCRKCMGQACQNSCAFGAVSMSRDHAYIDPNKCKECGKCMDACPYNAIAHLERPCKKVCPVDAITYDDYGICVINEDKCIQCGACIHSCPFGAVGTRTFAVDVIKLIKAGKRVVAMVAPSAEGQFGPEITMASWREALMKVGFADMVEVGLGGDMTAASEALEWSEAYKEGKKMTTSCCPAFVNMIKRHFPELLDNMSTTVSPMCGVSRMIKSKDPEAVTVFIGPCIAKKSECLDLSIEGNADYALTFGEIRSLLFGKGIELELSKTEYQESSVFGKRFGNSGGVTASVLECMKERGEEADINVCRCDGAAECKKALLLLKLGRLPGDFIEGMACEGGCVGGPSKNKTVKEFKKDRDTMIAAADGRNILDNLANYPMEDFSMHRIGEAFKR
ncbi:MAG: 4Fe-4S dicluster domain-containing protein [Clostridiales bacterium]|nr:4Fe-4S dicluster domain-containing protein [Clostridiales bacterium]